MRVPTHFISITTRMILQVRPITHNLLQHWKSRAQGIPDPELRRQALASIATKTFHCEGGALYGLLAGNYYHEAIQFIVAYQTISDYLDNLCDRSTSQDPKDFRTLHESMLHALTPGAPLIFYYQFRKERDDGGYLVSLVQTCRDVLGRLSSYSVAQDAILKLASIYIDLQVHKHVRKEDRLPRLQAWYNSHKENLPEMSWYEFAACAGSTLSIFCIVSQLFQPAVSGLLVDRIKQAYFPWVQGLHILLDYLIDQEEDHKSQDLNFCSYYEDHELLSRRFEFFYQQAQASVSLLPDAEFHHLIIRGLLSIYLADDKVSHQKDIQIAARKLLKLGGRETFFFYLLCRIYRQLT